MKKLISFLLLVILFQERSLAQKNASELTDSIVKALATVKDDRAKLNTYISLLTSTIYNAPALGLTYQAEARAFAEKIKWEGGTALLNEQIGRLYWRVGDYAEARKVHLDALKYYQKIGDKDKQANTLELLAQDYLDDSRYDEAQTYLLKALAIAKDTDNKMQMASVYDLLNYLYDRQGNIVESTKMVYLFLKVNEEMGSKPGLSHGLAMLASNFQAIGNTREALNNYNQSLVISKELDNKFEQIDIYIVIGDIYKTIGQYDSAMICYAAGLKLAEVLGDARFIMDVHLGMGNTYLAQASYAEALKEYLLVEKGFKDVDNRQGLASLYSEMGIIYTRLHQYDEANRKLKEAIDIGRELKTTVPMTDYYRGISLLDSATGKWKDAYTHYRQYINIKDSSFNTETLKKLVASQIQYETDKKEAVARTEQEKKDLRAEEETKRQRNIRNSSFAVLGIVLIFSIVAFRQRNKLALAKKKSDELLVDKELLLREIHHRVKNNLEIVSSLLALQSAQIDDPNTKAAMQQGQNRVHSIGIVHQKLYQGDNLGAIEMKDYFLDLSETILDSFGAEGRVRIECAMEKLNVDIDTAVPLGLIVNELLTNTLKYAFPNNQRGEVRIKLEKKEGGILHLEVSDNGIGKSGVTHGTGFGGQLVSLLTRQLNGSMKEENRDGTHIYFDFKTEKVA